MEKITRVEIDGLFERFNYTLDFSNFDNPGLSIITAPNGYGKTTILKMIENFAQGDFLIFFKERYKEVRFFISNNVEVKITKSKNDDDDAVVTISDGQNESELTDPLGDNGFMHFVNVIEKYFPYLHRVGPKRWNDGKVGDIINLQQVLTRYQNHPALRRRWRRREVWVQKIISSLNVFSITTNRLRNNIESISDDENDGLMVKKIAENIKNKMREAIRDQFEDGRKKESNFPARIMSVLSSSNYPNKEDVLSSIEKLQTLEERYSRLGLIPNTETTRQFNMHIQSSSKNGAGLLVLKTYLDDVIEKFTLLEGLAKKIDIFSSSLNSLLAFKEITTTVDDGIVVSILDGDKDDVELESLSSGEQHLLVLIGRLIFETTEESMVLIDEPEISFHPEWQESFIGILSEIKKLNGFDVILATHSPILIGNEYWDNVIELGVQYIPNENINLSGHSYI